MRLNFSFFLLLAALATLAQPHLDARHLLLDGSLTDAEAARSPYVFNDFRKAARCFADTTTLYVRPWVYWVDDPDSPAVVRGIDGREPFGMVIKAKKLHFIGMGDRPHDVVFASQRGQTQGAVGNFTMFDFHVADLTVENLTMGNYCNVDLDYPLRPALARQKRNATITQAHVGYVHGDRLTARRVRFISRLNLNPLNGARESLYDSCHFECTDDALNGGNAVYRHCDFDFYGSKPFWSTFGRGPMFIDCDFYARNQNREMYFCKQGGAVTIIDCRYHAPSATYIGWTAYPQPWLRCYQRGFTLNGQPYQIGSRQPQNTLSPPLLTAQLRQAPFVGVSQHEARLLTGRDTLLLRADEGQWRVEDGFESYVALTPCRDGSVQVIPTNYADETARFCLVAATADGREGACFLTVEPRLLPPPAFLSPRCVAEGDTVVLTGTLQSEGRRDESRTTWLRDGIAVWVGYGEQGRRYALSVADVGHRLSATIQPKHHRSVYGEPVEISMESVISADMVSTSRVLDTDFSHLPCQWQPQVLPGYWTVDGFKPADTAEFEWSFDREKPMWTYGEGFNGAKGYGLLQAQRGARLMYTPVAATDTRSMSLELQVDPTKTAGQGFGSATGQYMDVCLGFDTRTLSGYGLRIIRTTKHGKAVDFYLVQYRDGQTTALTEAVSSTCYRTGCIIRVALQGGRLSAHVETTSPPTDPTLPNEVSLEAQVSPATYWGFALQHTGSCGESTTMLHRLNLSWE
ncbi:MAG: hypothetical protein IJ841_01205 [Prevotella sp.]|nr:hypothetical protein [Prevotella sp.]